MTTAKNLLEKFGIKNTVTIELNGIELKFNRDDSAFELFLNEVNQNNRLTPIRDYLLAVVDNESKETLQEIITIPSVPLALIEKVQEVFGAQIKVKVKN